MKKVFLLILAAILISVTFSCKKDNSTTTPATSFSVKVDGSVWTTSTITAIHVTGGGTTVTATKGGSQVKYILNIAGNTAGTYPLTNPNNIVTYWYGTNSISSIYMDVPVGQIVVTTYDVSAKMISGTFYFDGEDQDGVIHHFTEGAFVNVPLAN